MTIPIATNIDEAYRVKDFVLIVDGIEKMQYTLNKEGFSSHSELFVKNAERLRAPNCHIIYTVPISLAYNENLGTDFDRFIVLPMVKIDNEGIEALKNIIKKRVDINQVFENEDLLAELAKNSGALCGI